MMEEGHVAESEAQEQRQEEEEVEASMRKEYEAVCNKLNMDQSTMESAWSSYTDTRDYYALEVKPRC